VLLAGINNYYDALNHMLGFYPSFWWKICWVVTTPLTCVVRRSLVCFKHVSEIINKKAVLPQGNRAMLQVFFSVEVRQQHSLQV